MSLFDFFFPDQAQASHLRRIADQTGLAQTQQRLRSARANLSATTNKRRVEDLQDDLDSVCLVMEALIEVLDERGLVSRGEIAEKAHDIDARDGVIDGKITKDRKDYKPKLIIPD